MPDPKPPESRTVGELTDAVRASALPVALWNLVSSRILAVSVPGAKVLGLEPAAENIDWLSLLSDAEPVRRGLESIRSGLFDSYKARRRLRRIDGELLDVVTCVFVVNEDRSLAIAVLVPSGSDRPVNSDVTPLLGYLPAECLVDDRVRVPAGRAGADRVAELEQHLVRIAREVEAAGLTARGGLIPDVARVPALNDLTSRQWQILTRLLQGERVPTIARAMYLSPSTIRNHLSVIYKRLGVHSQAELIEKLQPTE